VSVGRSIFSRLLRPADRIAANAIGQAADALSATTFTPPFVEGGASFTARLTQACVSAAIAHNERAHEPLQRVSVSVGVGGTVGYENTASYRRIDLAAGDSVAEAVDASRRDGREPHELVNPGWLRVVRPLLRPVVRRLGDTLLVSNLGSIDLPGVRRVDFYPVARGPSAVAFGATTIIGGDSVLTIRARDLDDASASELLHDAIAHFR
jgi:hypothetical protein